MTLSPRERVRISLNHEEPDRVPTALGGGSYGLVDQVYLQLISDFDLEPSVPPFRTGHSISYLDDRLLEKLNTDIRYVYPQVLPNSPTRSGKEPDTFVDSYGQTWHKAVPYFYAGEGLLKHVSPQADLRDYITFPDPKDSHWMVGVAERAKMLRTTTDHFITMRMVSSHGPFQTACDLRGTENFMVDMALNPDFAQALLGQIADLQAGLLESAMQAGGQYFDMIELPGDDYASNLGTIISPRMFRRFIKPILARYIAVIRAQRPDIYIMFHSDGLITGLLDDIIEIGVDVIHPLEPLPGVDFMEIKKQYGKRVSFLGGIDISRALPGTQEEVISEVQTRIRQLGPGGGYILAPANHIQVDVPPENVITLFRSAKQYGKYPLKNP